MLDANKARQFIASKIRQSLISVGNEVEADMKARAPVDTGFLRNNIRHELTGSNDSLTLVFHSDASYSVYIEYGTSKMQAQPFFRPSLLNLEQRIQSKL